MLASATIFGVRQIHKENFFSIFLKMFLLEREGYRAKDIQRNHPSADSLPKQPQWSELNLSKAKRQKLLPGLLCECRGPSTWVILCCCLSP